MSSSGGPASNSALDSDYSSKAIQTVALAGATRRVRVAILEPKLDCIVRAGEQDLPPVAMQERDDPDSIVTGEWRGEDPISWPSYSDDVRDGLVRAVAEPVSRCLQHPPASRRRSVHRAPSRRDHRNTLQDPLLQAGGSRVAPRQSRQM